MLITMLGDFPFGTAMGLRINSFCKIFKDCGWNVSVLSEGCRNREFETSFRKGKYNGIDFYYTVDNNNIYNRLTSPYRYVNLLKKVIDEEKPDLIFSVSLRDRFYLTYPIIKKANIPMIIESSEWYDPSTFRFGRIDRNYIKFIYCWKYFFNKANGVVAISRMLESHYKEYTNNVIRIPTILDTDSVCTKINLTIDNKIRLLFAGTLARTKDSIKLFFEAFNVLGEKAQKFEVCICGVELAELQNHLGQDLYNRYKDLIICKGRVPQQTIADEYENSHFGIFIRPIQRSSNAGFSTKLGEGMSLGTPFIVNDTSDISLYIKNGQNGFIVDANPGKIAGIFTQILSMTNDQYNLLRVNARHTAETDFNCNNYASSLKQLIEKVIAQ